MSDEQSKVVDIEQARAERSIANDPVEQTVMIAWHKHGYNIHFVDNMTPEVDAEKLWWLVDQLRYIANNIENDLRRERR